MKHIYLLAAIIIIISLNSFSQDKFTVADIGYMISPANKYENPDVSSNIGYLSGTLNLPVFSKGNTTFLAGFRGNMWTVNYDPEQLWPTNYYSLGLTLTYNQKFKKNNSFLFVLLPRYNSDLRFSSSDAWQLGFMSYYIKRTSEKFLWKAGVYVNTEFFGLFVVPVFGLDWNLNNRFSISGDLPIWAKINYQISKKVSTGIYYIALVSTYRITGDFNDDYTSRYAIEPCLFADVNIAKNIYLRGKVGYAIDRKYPVYAKDDKIDWQLSMIKFGDDRTQLNPVINNGLFIEFTLSYKVDIPSDE
jgi:hypothetical protein